jgi:uncharacterized membrane protein
MSPENLADSQNHLARRKRYRRLYFGVMAAGIVGYLVLIFVWNSVESDVVAVAAVGIYWLAFVIALGIHHLGPVELEDERQREVGEKAAMLTVMAVGFVLILGAPGSVTLEQTGVYTAPSWFSGMMWGYALLFGIYALAHGYMKRQYS